MICDLKFKYLLFDFDGTLIDTNKIVLESLNESAKKFLKRDLNEGEIISILGRPIIEQMYELSKEYYMEMVDYYRWYYKQNQELMVEEFEGVINSLKELKLMGCKMAVVSSKGRNGIIHGLEKFGMTEIFDTIVSAADVKNHKPHEEPALMALENLSADKEEALMIGDSPYDIQCGKNAGIKTVMVNWSIFPEDIMLKYHPDYRIDLPRDLLNIARGEKI